MVKKYKVLVSQKAHSDIQDTFEYIVNSLENHQSALKLLKQVEKAILSLEYFPNRGSRKRVSKNVGNYRYIMIDRYILVYEVKEIELQVIIHTFFYSPRNV